jgi:riboflavin kinase / FMN adenylyltransferase
MKIHFLSTHNFYTESPFSTPTACALGMFDGIHLGHRMVLEKALHESRFLGVESVVVSFANHPQHLLSKTPTHLLSSLEERIQQFQILGFDHAVFLEFDDAFKSIPAGQFVEHFLVNTLHSKCVCVGYDYRFGKDRVGDGEFLTALGKIHRFNVQIIQPVRVHEQIISSTLIRKLLSYGDLETANTLLGRTYHVTGMVEPGFQRGRTIGFPTANLRCDDMRLIPALGTYGGQAFLNAVAYPAVCNVGLSPTFEDPSQPASKRVEVHLIGYQGAEFYDKPLTMVFEQRLRDERKFPSVNELIRQIQHDCTTVLNTVSSQQQ